MTVSSLTCRLATHDDVDELRALMDAAIVRLQEPFLSPEQIEASRSFMGLDLQLINDATYFVVEVEGVIAGCGGWSRRATLYGGDHSAGRDARLLDPVTEAARTRAMYTHPEFVRRGIGRLILSRCEEEARREGFVAMELMATAAGVPLYTRAGYVPLEAIDDDRGGVPVPLTRMRKAISSYPAPAR